MKSLETAVQDARLAPGFALCFALLAALTLVRLVALRYSVVDLYFDESQYWDWARAPAFGYFSKPPLVAWLIALAERICGSGEACIRSPAPILYFATSLIVYAIAQKLYDARVAFWAALTAALAPGVVFSARVISTDVPLLLFWALALLAYLQLLRSTDLRWAVVLGVALGFGLLAKYAMVYFVLCALVAAVVDRGARALWRTWAPWLALAIAAAFLVPNLYWNFEHGLVTFRHTGDNVMGSGIRLDPLRGFAFLASQFAVFGPIAFGALLVIVARLRTLELLAADRLLLAFAVPPLAVVIAVAFVTRAHPNWGAAGFIATVIVTVALLVRYQRMSLVKLGLAIGLAAQAILLVGDSIADRVTIPGLANGDLYRRTLGWRALGEAAGRLAERSGAATIVGERRSDVASLAYYQRDRARPVLVWPGDGPPRHHFDLARPLTAAAPEPILFVTGCPAAARLEQYFSTVEPLGPFDAPTGPSSARRYYAFKLVDARAAIGPLSACR